MSENAEGANFRVCIGWFGSLPGNGTIGDLCSVSVVSDSIKSLGYQVDVLNEHANVGGFFAGHNVVNLSQAIERSYDLFIFVCGPIIKGHPIVDNVIGNIIARKKIAIGVSLFDSASPMYTYPFDFAFAREGGLNDFGDVAVLWRGHGIGRQPTGGQVRKIIIARRGPQFEYGASRCNDRRVDQQIEILQSEISKLEKVEFTEVEHHLGRMSHSPEEIADVYANAALVITSRFHGGILSLANKTPFVAIDQISGGEKVSRLLAKTGWPYVYRSDDLDIVEVARISRRLLSGEGSDLIEAAYSCARADALVALSELHRLCKYYSGT